MFVVYVVIINLGFFGRKNTLIFEIVLIVIEFDVKAVIKRG